MAKRMTRMAAAAVAAACLTPLLLAGCASKAERSSRAAQQRADAEAPIAKASASVMRSKIKDWAAINDHTLIVGTQEGVKYRAETIGPCQGLAFASQVGFVTRGSFNQVDRTSSVVLGDGTRCQLVSFDEIRTAESKALDSYEKAGESVPKKDAKSGNERG